MQVSEIAEADKDAVLEDMLFAAKDLYEAVEAHQKQVLTGRATKQADHKLWDKLKELSWVLE